MNVRFILALALGFATAATAQTYPTKLVRIINAQGPGTVDVISRAYAQILSKSWGQPVIVEQRAGGGSILGAEAVSKAEPDGHTILVSSSAAYIVNQWVTKNMPYDPGRDLAPVFGMAVSVPVITVSANVPANSIAELVALAKKEPGKYTFASAGIGSATHLQCEIVWQEIGGIRLLHVPYKGIADVARAGQPGLVRLCGADQDAQADHRQDRGRPRRGEQGAGGDEPAGEGELPADADRAEGVRRADRARAGDGGTGGEGARPGSPVRRVRSAVDSAQPWPMMKRWEGRLPRRRAMATIPPDARALEAALRSLGMLYGASQPLEKTIAGAKDEAEAIKAYIERERPHLLAVYDLETLVRMIQAAREAKTDGGAGVEQYSPK